MRMKLPGKNKRLQSEDLELEHGALLEAQAELEASRARYAELYDSAPVGYATLNRAGLIEELNLAGARLLNCDRRESIRRPLRVYIALSDRKKFLQHLAQIRRHPGRASVELELKHRSGEPAVFVELITTPPAIDEGLAARYQSALIDITKRKQAEEALRESEERFRTMANAAPVMIWMSGPDKLCHYFNQRWLEFTGRTLEQEWGHGWAEGVHPGDLSRCMELYAASFDRREPFEMEYRLRRADGEYRWILNHGVPRFTPDGSFLGYIGSCKDCTSRREAEAVLKRSNDELESRVHRRTAELARSNKELERQIQERRQLEALVLSISEREQQRIGQDLHDGLCQQLTGIKFRSRLLEQKLSALGMAEAEDAHAIEGLLSQAVEQARGQAHGLYPVRLEADGLSTALQELAGSIAEIFGIECVCDSRKPVLVRDHAVAIHLYRIAQEAITNAIKHGKAGKVRVQLAERGGHIRLAIHDNGLGIPNASHQNAGAGLHIMNYRARTIGAALNIRPAERSGTLVTCSLPKTQLEPSTRR
jgi:PAS domain S-box-containing protein